MYVSTSKTASFAGCTARLQARPVAARRAVAAPIECRYRGKGTDLSKVESFKRHTNDTGSPEVQVAKMTARITQLTAHLKEHKKDYSSRRGLETILGQRKRLMAYMFRTDKEAYARMVTELGIKDKLSIAAE
ncbi:unnamed protein product [Pedinophyceae sp. YPF-701]|nr:unnamed protein product [Pedinophyceae sp. YPF-701]